MSSYVDMLQRLPIFADLKSADLEFVATLLTSSKFAAGRTIVQQGSTGDALFIIVHGSVKIALDRPHRSQVILATLSGEGEFFGEMSLVDDKPRSVNVIAAEDTVLLILEREQFEECVRRFPAVAFNMMAELSMRLRRAQDTIGNLVTVDVSGRVAGLLVELAKDATEVPEGLLIRSPPTFDEIATSIATTADTVGVVISELVQRGLIETSNGEILLLRKSDEEVP